MLGTTTPNGAPASRLTTRPRARLAALFAGVLALGGCSAAPDMFAEFSSLVTDDPAPIAPATAGLEPKPTADPAAAETAAKAAPGETASDKAAETKPAAKSADKPTEPKAAEAVAEQPVLAAQPAALTIAPSASAEGEAEKPILVAALTADELTAYFPTSEACRTVRLYKRPRVRISKKAKKEWREFAGHWGDGMWDGKLCQELVIDKIDEHGKVTLYDMQGYYTPWKRVPTAFRRQGEFLEDGRLRVDLGKMGVAHYEVREGKLYGIYDWGVSKARIAMVRKKTR